MGCVLNAERGVARLSLAGVSKTFGRNRALRGVALDVRPGEIHGLIGQNGCGKSTLAKVLTGYHAPDRGGRIEVDGVPLHLPVRPREARRLGVAVVHQNLGLIAGHTVLENLRVGRLRPHRVTRAINWRQEGAEVAPVLARLGRTVPLDVPVGRLPEEDRATVAIARALQDAEEGRGLIVFDEATRSLSRGTLEHFYELIDQVVATGTSVLLISHGLEEVLRAADRVTVLRDGAVVEAGVPTEGLDEAELAGLVLGRALTRAGRPVRSVTSDAGAGVRVAGLSGATVRDLDLTIAPGEVVGLTGLPDGGYREVPYLLAGADRAAAGTVEVRGETLDLPSLDVGAAMAHGIVLVPEGRETAGLAAAHSIADNLALPQVRNARPMFPVQVGARNEVVSTWMDRLDIRPRTPRLPVATLSGGNQQKVLLAKWLATNPRLLLLHEPTQAVDVGARRTIIEAIRTAAADGCAVLVAGGDENELALLCDRIVLIRDGQVGGELTADITPDAIVHLTYDSSARRALRPSRAVPPARI